VPHVETAPPTHPLPPSLPRNRAPVGSSGADRTEGSSLIDGGHDARKMCQVSGRRDVACRASDDSNDGDDETAALRIQTLQMDASVDARSRLRRALSCQYRY